MSVKRKKNRPRNGCNGNRVRRVSYQKEKKTVTFAAAFFSPGNRILFCDLYSSLIRYHGNCHSNPHKEINTEKPGKNYR
jgi:hypothetical protein